MGVPINEFHCCHFSCRTASTDGFKPPSIASSLLNFTIRLCFVVELVLKAFGKSLLLLSSVRGNGGLSLICKSFSFLTCFQKWPAPFWGPTPAEIGKVTLTNGLKIGILKSEPKPNLGLISLQALAHSESFSFFDLAWYKPFTATVPPPLPFYPNQFWKPHPDRVP